MTNNRPYLWWSIIAVLVVFISVLHYSTPTMKWQYHLIYMQGYFVPILIGAFQFGLKGGLGTALAISAIYFPHIMLQWGGFVDTNLMRFLQIVLFNVIGFVSGVISQQRMQESARYQRAARELERSLQKLREQSEQLSEMEEQLRLADRLAVIGELTASLAHEVRNPLGAILGATEILKEELPESARSSEFFKILLEETSRLSAVLENYLSFARKQKHHVAEVEIQSLVHSVTQLLGYSARKAGIRFRMDCPGEPIRLLANPSHLRQILMNLMLNSIQAMPDGGEILIEAEEAEAQIERDEQTKTGRAILLTIKDQGPGIPEEMQAKIFRPFYTTKTDGTGLGLAIVKRLVEENRWQLRVESKNGEGSVFTLTIPLEDEGRKG